MNPFKNASEAFRLANPHLHSTHVKTAIAGRSRMRVGIRFGMNKTEAEFAMILEAMKRKGDILRYEFEGVTLRFANVKYTPDFVVFGWTGDGSGRYNGFGYTGIKLIEVKGPFIKGNRERAIERFRHAKTYWPEFTLEMHQKTKEGWKQLI